MATTKKEMFALVRNALTDENLIAFIDKEIALLAKRNAKPAKPTKEQIANAKIKARIYDLMESGKRYTCSDIIKADDELRTTNASTSKVSALMRQMVADNLVEKIEEKRKSYFVRIDPVESDGEDSPSEESED